MEVILAAIGGLASGIGNVIVSKQESRYGRLPDWLSARDFQRQDNTMLIVLGGMAAVLVVILIATAIVARKS